MSLLGKIGVCADDITGSNDIGSMFAKHGLLTHVYSSDQDLPFLLQGEAEKPDVLILNTESRFDSPETAAAKVRSATAKLRSAGCIRCFNKTCSEFRGNIGAEFDAMLDELGLSFAPVVLGFPKHGRITRSSVHYVHGVPLSESPFRDDPVHPMRESDLVKILQGQTERRVAALHYSALRKGAAYVRAVIERERALGGYLICDVVGQKSLQLLAEVLCHEPVICGSSALAEALPPVWGERGQGMPAVPLLNGPQRGVLCAAGSLTPQTKAQVLEWKREGKQAIVIPGLELFSSKQREALSEQISQEADAFIVAGEDVLIHVTCDEGEIAASAGQAEQAGLSRDSAVRIISGMLAETVARIVRKTGLRRLAVAGGDTSAAVCKALGITGMAVSEEIETGLPACISLGEDPYVLVLKSGSFGTDSFLLDAVSHLRDLTAPQPG